MSLVNPRDRRFLPALKGGVSAPGRFYDKHKATHDNSCHRVLVTVHKSANRIASIVQHRYRVVKGLVENAGLGERRGGQPPSVPHIRRSPHGAPSISNPSSAARNRP